MARFRKIWFLAQLLLAGFAASLLSSCIAPGGDESDEIAQQPITGTGHGLVASFGNSRNRCSFKQRTTPDQFDLKCRIVVAVGGNEYEAQSKADGVEFEWAEPVGVEDAEISVRSCEVGGSGLSQDCVVSVHNPLGSNKVRVDVAVRELAPGTQQVHRQRTESRTVMLAYGAFTHGLIPQVPLSFRPNPKKVGFLDGIFEIIGIGEKKVAEVGYQTRSFDPLKFRFEGILSTCEGAEGVYFSTPHHVYLKSAKTGKVSVFAGSSNPESRFDLREHLSDFELSYEQIRDLWKIVYPEETNPVSAPSPQREAILNRLKSFQAHRLQVALGKRVRLACHPKKPGVVYILEGFDTVQEDFEGNEEGKVSSTGNRIWQVTQDQFSLVVMDWRSNDVYTWHDPRNPVGPNTLAPPRSKNIALGARFKAVMDMTSDSKGALYLADAEDHRVRRIDAGMIETVAGIGIIYEGTDEYQGPTYSTPVPGTLIADGSSAKEAPIARPFGLGVGGRDEIYFTSQKGVFRVEGEKIFTLDSDLVALDVAALKSGEILASTWGKPAGNIIAHQLIDLSDSSRPSVLTSGIVMHSLTPLSNGGLVYASSRVRNGSEDSPDYVDDGGIVPGKRNFEFQTEHSKYFPQPLLQGELRAYPEGNVVAGLSSNNQLYPLGGESWATEELQLPEISDLEMGKEGELFFIGEDTHSVFVIESTPEGRKMRHLLGTGTPGCSNPSYTNGPFLDNNGNPIPPHAIQLNHPRGLGLDKAGNLYVADTNNNRILKVEPNSRVSQVVGMGCTETAENKNPYFRKSPTYRFVTGPGTQACADKQMSCDRSESEDGSLPPGCDEDPLAECVLPELADTREACTTDAHPWRPTEVAIWDKQLYILLYERNSILRMDLSQSSPSLSLAVNDPWGIEQDIETSEQGGQPSFGQEHQGSYLCPKLGVLAQITDIAVDSDENLFVADFKRFDHVFQIPSADLVELSHREINPSSPPRADATNYVSAEPYGKPVLDAVATLGTRRPVALAPNPNGGLYALYANRSQEEQEGVIAPGTGGGHDLNIIVSYFYPVPGGDTLVNLVPAQGGFRAHVLASQEGDTNKDCGSGVISGEVEKDDLESALKASISSLCRSYARSIASYPTCLGRGKDSGFAMPQSFTNSRIYNPSIRGEPNPPVSRPTEAPVANILGVHTPCLIE